MSAFFQNPPMLGNQYECDWLLQCLLRQSLPADVMAQIEPGLRHLGALAADDMVSMAHEAEQYPPRHIPYDPWGKRVDRIETSRGWRGLIDLAAEQGIVAAAYDNAYGQFARVDQFARLYLYHASSSLASCPLSMTDGAARVIARFGNDKLKRSVLPQLTSLDPAQFWTSGQWMTERAGGSDVRASQTVARPDAGHWRLYGSKWFTSATTGEIAMTLARAEENGKQDKKLSLFYVKVRNSKDELNNIFIHRLKDKLGTRALPTAELTLEGTVAMLVGERERGIAQISSILNITRYYNAAAAVSVMRRGVALACDYAEKRRVFGRLLSEQPLHVETLQNLKAQQVGALHLVFAVACLLGREECDEASVAESRLLRLLTPIVKLYTAKQAIAVTSEVLECFGGQGYIEDTGLPVLLRDCQVLSIWEGTTNVLALDVLRALKDDATLGYFLTDCERKLAQAKSLALAPATAKKVADLVAAVAAEHEVMNGMDSDAREARARRFAFLLARCYAAVLMAESVAATNDAAIGDGLQRWLALGGTTV